MFVPGKLSLSFSCWFLTLTFDCLNHCITILVTVTVIRTSKAASSCLSVSVFSCFLQLSPSTNPSRSFSIVSAEQIEVRALLYVVLILILMLMMLMTSVVFFLMLISMLILILILILMLMLRLPFALALVTL